MLSSPAKLHILYILYTYFVYFLCIFNTLVPHCGTRFYPVAGAGAGFIVVGSLAARAASNERRRSEEEARNERTRPSAVSRCPQPLPSAVALSPQPLPSAVAVSRCPLSSAVAVAVTARRQVAGGGGWGLRFCGWALGGRRWRLECQSGGGLGFFAAKTKAEARRRRRRRLPP